VTNYTTLLVNILKLLKLILVVHPNPSLLL
jgi:hypothetical protein